MSKIIDIIMNFLNVRGIKAVRLSQNSLDPLDRPIYFHCEWPGTDGARHSLRVSIDKRRCTDEPSLLTYLNDDVFQCFQYGSQPYLARNEHTIMKAINDAIIASAGVVNDITYKLEGEKGSGIYANFFLENKLFRFFYLERDCKNMGLFLNELNTDFGLLQLDQKYHLARYILKRGEHSFDTSYANNVYKGWKGLDEFWNAGTCTIDWDAFNLFASRVNRNTCEGQLRNQNASLKALSVAGVFAPAASLLNKHGKEQLVELSIIGSNLYRQFNPCDLGVVVYKA